MSPAESVMWNAARCRHCAHRGGWKRRLASARLRRYLHVRAARP